jgi:hypothetical protein
MPLRRRRYVYSKQYVNGVKDNPGGLLRQR